jgi:hypothetical protein
MSSELPSDRTEASLKLSNDASGVDDDIAALSATLAFYVEIDVDKGAMDAEMAKFAVENMNEAEKKVCYAYMRIFCVL